MPPTRIYLVPGMFGFARLAGFDYFQHVEAALERRFREHGHPVEIHAVDAHPTASIPARAAKLVQALDRSAGPGDAAIHLVGHSSGGLDARLVASPSARLSGYAAQPNDWTERLRSITTINTPHHGTPLAAFFATAKGQRMLYAVSAITVSALRLGAPPLAVASALVATLARARGPAHRELDLTERIIAPLLRLLDDAASLELRSWLRRLREDQAIVVQLMPEAMEIFNAGVEDRPGLRYQCVASYVLPSLRHDWLRALRSPWGPVSAALFRLMYRLTSRTRGPGPGEVPGADGLLRHRLGELPPTGANDGVVPLRSQLWGDPVWIGKGDHLDVIGHFRGRRGGHTDWLTSGARFDRVRFETLMDRVFEGMIEAGTERSSGPPAPGSFRPTTTSA